MIIQLNPFVRLGDTALAQLLSLTSMRKLVAEVGEHRAVCMVLTIVSVESDGTASAISPWNRNGTRDYGLMGLNSSWALVGNTVHDLLTPTTNLLLGVDHLAASPRYDAPWVYRWYNTGNPSASSAGSRYVARCAEKASSIKFIDGRVDTSLSSCWRIDG